MPRANSGQRLARDQLVFDLWVAGHSYRDIADHPKVQLSLDVVHTVVCRERAMLDAVERLEENFAVTYQAAEAGDAAAARRGRLILARLAPLLPPPEGPDLSEPMMPYEEPPPRCVRIKRHRW
jgi:hypothetical protein